jgi:hypothetical protein
MTGQYRLPIAEPDPRLQSAARYSQQKIVQRLLVPVSDRRSSLRRALSLPRPPPLASLASQKQGRSGRESPPKLIAEGEGFNRIWYKSSILDPGS